MDQGHTVPVPGTTTRNVLRALGCLWSPSVPLSGRVLGLPPLRNGPCGYTTDSYLALDSPTADKWAGTLIDMLNVIRDKVNGLWGADCPLNYCRAH